MKEVITIQIIRPELEGLSDQDTKKLIDEMAKEIAVQIIHQEGLRKKHEEVRYWQQKMLEWKIEDQITEMKYGKLRSDQQRD